ncbi:hypothetical protein WJX72_001872 [[Myrmecia] bisecta]|uniref:Thiamine pyrimidine synthase n=1 Tax=[Myrmecia] bisecta TaxID=41462 RepID=A0AAW1PJ81_9CHLO
MVTTVSVALDWTPNTNHTGFYVAKQLGLYQRAGLDVQLLSPHIDNYQDTPAARVASKQAIFAVTPSETVISYHTQPGKPKLQAVATILSSDTSVVATLKSSGIDRPSKLDGKVYASYGARYEGRIVQQLIKNDGGKGDYQEVTPAKLGIWNTLLAGKADATWIFEAWEGIEAKQKGVELNAFRLGDYGVPYGYSPLLVAHPDTLREQPDVVRAFLAATAEGFRTAASQPEQAAQHLVSLAGQENASPLLPVPLDLDMVTASQRLLQKHYLDANKEWGRMEKGRWDTFLDWLSQQGLLTTAVQSRSPEDGVSVTLDDLRQGKAGEPVPRETISSDQLFTNDFLPGAKAT